MNVSHPYAPRRSALTSVRSTLAAALLAACGTDANPDTPGPSDRSPPGVTDRPTPSRSPLVSATHTASTPFARSTGPALARTRAGHLALAHEDGGFFLADAQSGEAIEAQQWPLPAGQPVIPTDLVSSPNTDSEEAMVFLAFGSNNVGLLPIADPSDPLRLELTDEPLATPYPSEMAAPAEGPARTALWIVDGAFGAEQRIRAYPWRALAEERQLFEDTDRRVRLPMLDDDGDGAPDAIIAKRLVFDEAGSRGYVSFTHYPALPGIAGGIDAFDATDGRHLGRLLVPMNLSTETGTTTEGFVCSMAVAGSDLFVAVAHKALPDYSDLGGDLVRYRSDFFRDRDARTPIAVAKLQGHNPVQLAAARGAVYVLGAPYQGDASLEVLDAVDLSALDFLGLGSPWRDGQLLPGRITVTDDGLLVPTERGLWRFDWVAR